MKIAEYEHDPMSIIQLVDCMPELCVSFILNGCLFGGGLFFDLHTKNRGQSGAQTVDDLPLAKTAPALV